MENSYFNPRLSFAQKLAGALQVRVEWLLTGDEPMLWLVQMTADEQHAQHNGPGSEGLPRYVIDETGPWLIDDEGNWHVEAEPKEEEAV